MTSQILKKLEYIHKSFSFDSFKSLLLVNTKTTKEQFKRLRDLQKSFEDIFNKPKLHNYLKMSLLCSGNNIDDKYEIINYFIGKKNDAEIKDEYAKWRLVGATHLEITDPSKSTSDETKKEDKAQEVLDQLSGKYVYQNAYDLAAKQLLRLNVEEDNKLFNGKGRKFDFSIYENKSLEHIHPKSKVFHKDEITNEDDSKTVCYKNGNEDDLGTNKPQGDDWLDRDSLIRTQHWQSTFVG